MVQLTVVLSIPLMQYLHDLDIGILKAIYENRISSYDPAFIAITDSAAAIAFGVPGIFFIISLITKNPDLRRNALRILLPVALSAIAANILKYSIDLPRPYEIYPFIGKLSGGGSPTFPSGHTADAFAYAIAAILVKPKWYIIFPCLIWAALVGYSRMRLGVHFPSDVFAGALIGTACAYTYYWIVKRKLLTKVPAIKQ